MTRILKFFSFVYLLFANFHSFAQPAIAAFNPLSGAIGSSVTITGINFSPTIASNKVMFGDVPAVVTAASATSLTVNVPAGAGYQPISVLVDTKIAYSSGSFIVTYNCNYPLSNSFAAKIDSIAGTKPVSVAIADLNNDGKPDLVVTNETSNTMSLYLNNGTEGIISFLPKTEIVTGTTPKNIAVGDLNGSGLPEIVVANYGAGTVSVYKNSTGTNELYYIRYDFPAGLNPVSPLIADFNADGRADIAVTNQGNNTVSVLMQYYSPVQGIYALKGYYINPANPTITGPVQVMDGTIELRPTGTDQVAMYWQGLQAHPVNNGGTLSYFASQQPGYTISGPILSAVTNILTTPAYTIDGTYPNRYDIASRTIYAKYSYSSTRFFTDTLTYMAPLPDASLFFIRTDFATGTSPTGIAAADIDNDNRPDLIVTNAGDGSFSILRNTSSGGNLSFAARKNYSAGTSPNAVATADIDNDGKIDIAVSNTGSNTISLFRNKSVDTIALDAKIDLATSASPAKIAFADLNGNGKVDLAVSNKNANTVSLFENNSTVGVVSFAAKVDYPTGLAPEGLALADIDKDGKIDIAVSNTSGNSVSLLRSNSRQPVINSFTPQSGFTGDVITIKGLYFTGISTVTFNNSPAGSFTIVNDTTLSVVIGTGSTGAIKISSGCGFAIKNGFTYSGTPLISSFTPASGPVGTTVTINGSNFSTTAANNFVRVGTAAATVVAATGNMLTVKVPFGATSQPISLSINQLTTFSANPFFVNSTGCNAGLSATSFDTSKNFPVPGASWMFATGDIDGDGKTDIAYANYDATQVSVYRNIGEAGTLDLAPRLDYFSGSRPDDVVLTDFDGDNKPDMISVNSNDFANNLSIFRNTSSPGTVSFAGMFSIPTGVPGDKLTTGDLDGDGRIDLVITWSGINAVTVLKNTSTIGNISFAAPLQFPSGEDGFTVINDYDGDGKLDIAVNNWNANTVSILRNTSNAVGISFAPRKIFTTLKSPLGIASADMDGDNKKDIVIVYYQDTAVSVFKNNSIVDSIILAPRLDLSLGGGYSYAVAVGDLDGDGKQDIAATANNGITVFKNSSTSGTLSFLPRLRYSNPATVNLAIADMDADGKPDFITGINAGKIGIVRNQLCEVVSMCPGASAIINSPVVGSAYQWQINTGGGFVNLVDTGHYTGSNSNQLQLLSMPSVLYGTKYRCIVDGVPTKVSSLRFVVDWTGATNLNWENPANWGCNTIPDANTDVLVSIGTTFVNSSTVCRSVAITPGGNIVVTPGVNLTILH